MTWICTPDSPQPEAVERILATLPEWFGLPEANGEYIDAARTKETWTVRGRTSDSGDLEGTKDGDPLAVMLVDRHFPHVAEIHFMAITRAARRQGIGRVMVEALEADARSRGVALLQVKTLGASHPDEGYAETRHFYEAMGFLALEETDLWGEDNPCLFMVKPLATSPALDPDRFVGDVSTPAAPTVPASVGGDYDIRDEAIMPEAELVALYDSVGWSAYTKDSARLARAIAGSAAVATARMDGELVGLARAISDGASIVYVQDILVSPEHQRQGLATALVTRLLRRLPCVRQTVLMTDAEPGQRAFYESLGFTEVHDTGGDGSRAFVRFDWDA